MTPYEQLKKNDIIEFMQELGYSIHHDDRKPSVKFYPSTTADHFIVYENGFQSFKKNEYGRMLPTATIKLKAGITPTLNDWIVMMHLGKCISIGKVFMLSNVHATDDNSQWDDLNRMEFQLPKEAVA